VRSTRRTIVDSRQLAFAWGPEPCAAPSASVGAFVRVLPSKSFERIDAPLAQEQPKPAPSLMALMESEATPDRVINGETQAIVAIDDLLFDLWQEATGEDLRPSIFDAQNE